MGSWKTIAAQSITLTPHHSILSPRNFVFLSPPCQDFFFLPSQYFCSSKVRISFAPPTLFSPSVIPLRVTKTCQQAKKTYSIETHSELTFTSVSQLVQPVIVILSNCSTWIDSGVDLLTKLISRKSYLIQKSTGPMSQLVSKLACSLKGLEITTPTNFWIHQQNPQGSIWRLS